MKQLCSWYLSRLLITMTEITYNYNLENYKNHMEMANHHKLPHLKGDNLKKKGATRPIHANNNELQTN